MTRRVKAGVAPESLLFALRLRDWNGELYDTTGRVLLSRPRGIRPPRAWAMDVRVRDVRRKAVTQGALVTVTCHFTFSIGFNECVCLCVLCPLLPWNADDVRSDVQAS